MKLEDQIKRVHEICGSWGMFEEGQSSEIKQLLYAAGEAGELAIAIAKNDIEGIKDGIGDTLVCLINSSKLSGSEIHQDHPPIESFTLPEIISCIGNAIRPSIIHQLGSNGYSKLAFDLDCLSRHYGLNLEECLQQAINEISKRTGKFVNGVFVKDQK